MDKISKATRSAIMSRVKSKNTLPEKIVRSLLHRMGYRFRLHRKDLPGKPDIVLPRFRLAIFVHGCFWHGHPNCRKAIRPTSNIEFWNKKLSSNIERGKRNVQDLEKNGWNVLVIWECETKNSEQLLKRIHETIQSLN